MFEAHDQTGAVHESSPVGSLTRGLGYLCIVIGFLIAGWLFLKIYGFVNDPSSFAEFQQLLTEQLEITANMKDEDAKIVIPTEPLGYLLLVILFGITVSIAGVFLSTGAKLLDRETQVYLKKLSRAQTKIVNKIDNIRTTIKERGIK